MFRGRRPADGHCALGLGISPNVWKFGWWFYRKWFMFIFSQCMHNLLIKRQALTFNQLPFRSIEISPIFCMITEHTWCSILRLMNIHVFTLDILCKVLWSADHDAVFSTRGNLFNAMTCILQKEGIKKNIKLACRRASPISRCRL